MRSDIRTLTPILLSALLASVAQGQSAGTPLLNGTIGVQFEFVPFSVPPRTGAPQQTWIVPAAPALNCPMPVLRGNTTGDTAMVARPAPTVPPRPVPGATADAAPPCDNPLGQPHATTVFIW